MISTLFSVAPRRPSLAPAVALALALATWPGSSAEAQTLKGRVLDGISQRPIENVTVSLVHPDGTVLTETTAGEDGSFSMEVPGAGDYFVRAERTRYHTLWDGVFEFQEEGLLEVSLFLRPRPVEVEGLEVEVERTAQKRRRLRSQGFYERAAAGFGRFIGPEKLEERQYFFFSDILRGIPGIIYTGDSVRFRGYGLEPTCAPNIYIDGARTFADAPIEALVQPEDVVGVEVYRRVAETPMQWGGLNGSCGSLVIWTKTGR